MGCLRPTVRKKWDSWTSEILLKIWMQTDRIIVSAKLGTKSSTSTTYTASTETKYRRWRTIWMQTCRMSVPGWAYARLGKVMTVLLYDHSLRSTRPSWNQNIAGDERSQIRASDWDKAVLANGKGFSNMSSLSCDAFGYLSKMCNITGASSAVRSALLRQRNNIWEFVIFVFAKAHAISLITRVDSRDLQTSNISIWRYHCLKEVAFLKIRIQYWLQILIQSMRGFCSS